MSKQVGLFTRPSGYAALTPPLLKNIFDFAGMPDAASQIEACRNVCARWRAAIAQCPLWQTYQNICMGRFQVSQFSLPKGKQYFFPRGRQDIYLSEDVNGGKVSIWDLNTRELLGELDCNSLGNLSDFHYSQPSRRPWVHGNQLILNDTDNDDRDCLIVYDFVKKEKHLIASIRDPFHFRVVGNQLVYKGRSTQGLMISVFNLDTLKPEAARTLVDNWRIIIGWEEMNNNLLLTGWTKFSIDLIDLKSHRCEFSEGQDHNLSRIPETEAGFDQRWVPIQAVHVREKCALIARRDFRGEHPEIYREFDRRLVQLPAHDKERRLCRFGYYAAPMDMVKFAPFGEGVIALGSNVRVYDFSRPAEPVENAFYADHSKVSFLPKSEYEVEGFPRHEVQLFKGKMHGIDIENHRLVVCDFTKAPEEEAPAEVPEGDLPAEESDWCTQILNAIRDFGRCLLDCLCGLFSQGEQEE